jgi:hypothetical protein
MTKPTVPTDPAKLLDAALDVFVYAPIGFLFDAREVVPKLAERGKGQVALARLFGRYAWQRGQREADRILDARRPAPRTSASATADDTAPGHGASPARETTAVGDDAAPVARVTAEPADAADTATTEQAGAPAGRAPKSGKRTSARTKAADPSASASLAIPGYDALSASQVVPRLDALLPEELEAVRAYEAAHRGRRTILNRIAQLQA